MIAVTEKRRRFRQLHEKGCFLLPNPWDLGSALFLQSLGAKALATTSAGFAFSRGLPDGAVPAAAMIEHCREMAAATELPVNADFEHGYADDLRGLGENVAKLVEAGVSGLSIEDSTGRSDSPLFEVSAAAERIAAAKEAIRDTDVILVGRAECYLVGHENIDETIGRLRAYADAGADCLYAPGVSRPVEIKAIAEAVEPKPVNVLISGPGGLTLDEAEALGVRRISVGGALARAAWGGFERAATQLLRHGSFDGFTGAMPHGDLQKFFQSSVARD